MLLAVLAVTAPASAIDPVLVDPTTGMAAPAGAFRDNNGHLWVSDHLGICRVVNPPHGGSALVEDPIYCGLARTAGPVAPSQASFDPSSGNIYVGDAASASGGVWRLHLDQSQNPAVIDSAVKILDLSDPLVGDRVFGVSYHRPTSELAFSTKNATTIQRIHHPEACSLTPPQLPCQPQALGSAEEAGASSLVHDSQARLYVADLSGVTRIPAFGTTFDTQARPVPGMNLGLYTALAFDPDNDGGRLYAGTTNGEGVDWIDVLKVATGESATYSVGFDGVTAIGVDGESMPEGRLDVIDDTCVKQTCEDVSRARRFTVDFEQFAPAPQIVDAPPPVTNVKVASFFYRYSSSTSFFCKLDTAAPVPCGTGMNGTISYSGLPSGAHTFTLFAGDPVSGPRTIRRFAVDTRAPIVSIDSTTVSGTSVEFGLSSDDLNVDYTCRLDAGLPTPCDTPARYAGLTNGLHTFTVHATDFVGNVGPSVTTTFQIGPPALPPWTPGTVTATLRGLSLRVVFNAPPGATFARLVLAKTSGVKVRSKVLRVKAGVKNTITIRLTRAEALKLQRQTVTVRITAGTGSKALTTKAGQGKLKVVARLAQPKAR